MSWSDNGERPYWGINLRTGKTTGWVWLTDEAALARLERGVNLRPAFDVRKVWAYAAATRTISPHQTA